ncbi:MAG: SPOR domain-containing protein [Blastocatellia bacterium]|jgi:cell division septation protein DedD
MKVICPKCQYENQCNSSQVFCARCATMIDVRSARESRPETQMGLDLTPSRPKARLPFAATPGSQAGDEPYQNQGSVPIRPVREDRGRRDAYATRIGDDFEDLLEISPPVLARPRPETSPLLDEKLYETNTTGWSGVDLPAGRPAAGNIGAGGGANVERGDYAGQRWESGEAGNSGTAYGASFRAGGGSRETRDISDFAAMGAGQESSAGAGAGNGVRDDVEGPDEIMGWPVLTNSSNAEEDNEYEDITRRQGLLMRIVLGAAVFAGLIGGAYFFLGDLISKRQDQSEGMQVAGQTASGTAVPVPTIGPTGAVPPASAAPVSTELPPAGDAASGVAALPGSAGQSQAVDIPPMTGRAGYSEEAKPLLPEPLPAPVASPASTSGNWTIQVASYSDKGQAGARVAGLKSSNIPARLVTVQIPGKGTWYRVQIGGYDTREEGARQGNQLRSRGVIQDFIVTGISR